MAVLRYFASIRAEAGVSEELVEATNLAAALAAASESRGGRFADVLRVCSFLVDGAPAGARDHARVLLEPDSTVDCLPPFAGG